MACVVFDMLCRLVGGAVSHEECKARVMGGANGDYLIRLSPQQPVAMLLINDDGDLVELPINLASGCFEFLGRAHKNFEEIIGNLQANPLQAKGGRAIILNEPASAMNTPPTNNAVATEYQKPAQAAKSLRKEKSLPTIQIPRASEVERAINADAGAAVFTEDDAPIITADEGGRKIPVAQFGDYVGELREAGALHKVFAQLDDQMSTIKATHGDALLPENMKKNRYTNVLPYDYSRVRLNIADGGGDFINANYVNGYGAQKEYICCQGPLSRNGIDTVVDFWRMVWQQNVSAVVMTTRTFENGRKKCEEYWPAVNTSVQHGQYVSLFGSSSASSLVPSLCLLFPSFC